MKDIYKNKNFYYVLVPVLAAVMAFSSWLVSSTKISTELSETSTDFKEEQKVTAELLDLDPGRLKEKDASNKNAENFAFGKEIDIFARKYQISTSQYKVLAKGESTKGGQKSVGATITITSVDIKSFSNLLAALLKKWPGLQCDSLDLRLIKPGPDNWDATLSFTFYY